MQPENSVPHGPRVQLTLGSCLFTGMFECPCTAGCIVGGLMDMGLQSRCESCGHAVSLHRELEESSLPTPRALSWLKSELGILQRPTPEDEFTYKTDLKNASYDQQLKESPRTREALDNQFLYRRSTLNTCRNSEGAELQEHVALGKRRRGEILQEAETNSLSKRGPQAASTAFQPSRDDLANSLGDNPSLPGREIEDTYICPRHDTVSTIAKMLEESGAILIWGMPGSGKSTLGRLLVEYYGKRGEKSVLINDWPVTRNEKIEVILTDFCQRDFPETDSDIFNESFVFIIDEAQNTLQKSKRLWNNLIKKVMSRKSGPRFCFLSDEGKFPERNSVFERVPEISYLTSHGACEEDVGIFYTEAEFEDIVLRTTSRKLGYRLSMEAVKHLFYLTAGCPSIVRSILSYLEMFHWGASTPRRRLKRLLSLEGAVEILCDDARLFRYLGDKVYPGSFARKSNVALKVFQKLLSAPEGRISWNSEFNTTGKCFENGLICHEVDVDGHNFFKFPSPLHERWARWYHGILPNCYEGEMTPELG